MSKEHLIKIIQDILKANVALSFLLKLETSELETLVASIRGRVDQVGQ